MREVLLQVVDDDAGLGDDGRHHVDHVTTRYAADVHGPHVRLDGLEHREELEPSELGPVEVTVALDEHLEYADGRVLDAAELAVDELDRLLEHLTVAQLVLLEEHRDALRCCRADVRNLQQCRGRKHHDRSDRRLVGQLHGTNGLHDDLVIAEYLSDGGGRADGADGHHCVPLPWAACKSKGYVPSAHTQGIHLLYTKLAINAMIRVIR